MRSWKSSLLLGVRFCKQCGARILLQGYDTQNRKGHIMKTRQLCFECAFWNELIDYPPECMEVLGCKCLKIYPMADKRDKTSILGGKGKTRYFIKNHQPIRSNDIWVIGTIPERFRDKLPPTVTEIPQNIYKRLDKNSKRCRAKGCFDRYKCLRYMIEKEAKPYNQVPKNWKAGDEHCQFFINLDDITNLNN